MSTFVASLPMYDWPERRVEVDAEWAAIRNALRGAGIDAPQDLTRGREEHDVWRDPNLLFGQTCWGPMNAGMSNYLQVIAQPSYDGIEGGHGINYSSAIVMRRSAFTFPSRGEVAPLGGAGGGESLLAVHPTPALRADPPPPGESGSAQLPLDLMRGQRFAYNNPDSMSGLMGLKRDLEALGESLDMFSERIETGGHRLSVKAVAEGRADIATIDCRSWVLAQLYEPEAASQLRVIGWTSLRPGLPFVTARSTSPGIVALLRSAVASVQLG